MQHKQLSMKQIKNKSKLWKHFRKWKQPHCWQFIKYENGVIINNLALTLPRPCLGDLSWTLPWSCPNIALTLPWPCPDLALTLSWPCPGFALALPWPCLDLALTLSWPFLDLVLNFAWPCLDLALILSWAWLHLANLPLKFGQNRISNSWDIPDMDKCCLDSRNFF